MGFRGTGKPSYSSLDAKPIATVSSTGSLFQENTNAINSIRLSVFGAGTGNIVRLEGTIDGTNWEQIGLLGDNGTVLFSTQAYQMVRADTLTYAGTPFTFSYKLEDHPAQPTVEEDGSINVNVTGVNIPPLTVQLDAFSTSPDSALSVGSEDGTTLGLRHVLKVLPDGTLVISSPGSATAANQVFEITELITINSQLSAVNTSLSTISGQLPATLGQKVMAASLSVTMASDQSPIPVVATLGDEPVKISGTENGQPNGTEFTFVNNLRNQILAAKDREQDITYADFGTKNQRITQIDYTAPSIGSGTGFTARKTLTYTLVGNRYRRDSIDWTMV